MEQIDTLNITDSAEQQETFKVNISLILYTNSFKIDFITIIIA